MKIHNWIDYRIPGLITIALYKDFVPGKFKYIIALPDFEEQTQVRKAEQSIIPKEPLELILTEAHVKSHLKIKYGFDLGFSWHTLFDLIYNFGGANINPESKGFLAFIPLTKEKGDGINWDVHERDIMPSSTIPRRK